MNAIDAPERIWAGEDAIFTRRWREDDQNGGTEYIRADLASPQPANPAQVTDAVAICRAAAEEMIAEGVQWRLDPRYILRICDALETAAIGAGRSSEPEFETAPDNGTPAEVMAYVLDCARRWVPEARIIGNARAGDIERAIAAIGAGGQAVACKECDGTGFKDKNGARLTLARTPCGACAGSGYVAALSQPHPADERVVEALREAANIAFDEMFAVTGAPVARAVQQKILALSVKEGQ